MKKAKCFGMFMVVILLVAVVSNVYSQPQKPPRVFPDKAIMQKQGYQMKVLDYFYKCMKATCNSEYFDTNALDCKMQLQEGLKCYECPILEKYTFQCDDEYIVKSYIKGNMLGYRCVCAEFPSGKCTDAKYIINDECPAGTNPWVSPSGQAYGCEIVDTSKICMKCGYEFLGALYKDDVMKVMCVGP